MIYYEKSVFTKYLSEFKVHLIYWVNEDGEHLF